MAETIIKEEKQYGAPLPSSAAVQSGCPCTDTSAHRTDDAVTQITRLLQTHLDAFVVSDGGGVLVAALPDGSMCEISLYGMHKNTK